MLINDMVLSNQHISYNLPDGRTRVTRLLNSITSNDATVVSAKTQILASPQLEHNFEAAAEFLLKCCNKKLSQNNQAGQGHRTSAVNTGNESLTTIVKRDQQEYPFTITPRRSILSSSPNKRKN